MENTHNSYYKVHNSQERHLGNEKEIKTRNWTDWTLIKEYALAEPRDVMKMICLLRA